MSRPPFFSWQQAVGDSNLHSTTKLVLHTISLFMNKYGQGAYPTIRTLAEKASLSDRVVCHHIKLATKAGFLKVGRHGFAGQRWANNEYEVCFPDDSDEEKGDDAKSTPSREQIENTAGKAIDAGSTPSDAKVLTLSAEGTDFKRKKVLTQGQTNNPLDQPMNQATLCAGVRDAAELESVLREAAGLENAISPRLFEISEPLNWLASGCDLEQDILPTLKSRSHDRISSWAYFTRAVFEARDKRLRPSPEPRTFDTAEGNTRRQTNKTDETLRLLAEAADVYDARNKR